MEEPLLKQSDDALDRRDLMVLGAFLLFLLLFFAHALLQPGGSVLGRAAGDARSQFYGWRVFGFDQVRQGHFPLWNPYEFLGMPFVASLQSAMFYPFHWLCAVMPMGRGINLGILLNLFCSGAFTYLWCRRLGLRWQGAAVAMVGYAFCAQQVLRVFEGHWSFLAPMAWTPAILLCIEEALRGGWRPLAVAGGALAVAMQWFGGNPQYLFYGGIAAFLYVIGRLVMERARGSTFAYRVLVEFGAIYLLGTLLAGAQVLPAVEMLGLSSRKGQLTYDWISQYPIPPENLVTLLSPDFFGGDIPMRYWGRWNLWESSAYIGVIVFALAFIGLWRGRRKLGILAGLIALFFLLMALGKATPLLRIFYETLPGFDLFRSPGRYLYPFSLFMALLAGMGMDALMREAREEKPKPAWRPCAWVIGLGAVALVLIGALLAAPMESVKETWFSFMRWMLNIGPGQRLYLPHGIVNAGFVERARLFAGLDLVRTGLLLGGFAIVLWLLRYRRLQWFLLGTLLLVAADAWSFGHRYMVSFDPSADGLTPGAVQYLSEKPGAPFRFIRAGCYDFPPCEGMDHDLWCLEGVQPNVPARFRDLFWTIQEMEKGRQNTAYAVRTVVPPLLMLNVRYFVQYKNNPVTRQIEGLKVGVYQDERIRIDELPVWFPRAWLVHSYAVVPDPDEVLKRMLSFSYARQALFESDPHLALSQPPVREPAPEFTAYEADRLALKVRAGSDAILLLSELHFPGWEATVDGRPVEILRANYAMRAIALPAGEHEVEFRYRPASFRNGLIASGIGLILCLALTGFGLWRRRGARGAQ